VLADTAREAARRFGDATAYVAPRGWGLTYSDLDRVSDEVAAGLAQKGLGRGDVLSLVLPPGVEYVVAYLAATKLGAVTAGVNHRLTASERAAVLDRAGPAFVLASPGTEPADHRAEVVAPAPALDDLLPSLRVRGAVPDRVAAAPDDPVAIVFTSGTTGVPKGARFCHRQLAFVTRTDVGDSWGGGTQSFTGTSFAHLGFMTKLEGNLRRGGTTHILERWSAGDALRLLVEHRMTTVAGVPAQLALMLRHPDFDRLDVSSVRFVVVGGGPLTPGLADEIRQRFGAQLATRYSCTEAGVGLGTAFDDPPEDAVESVGRPHPSVELAVLDAQDRLLPAGSTGAICLRSPAVMSGYWRDAAATAAAFTADGFVRTGDLGAVDDRGRLQLAGRSTEMYVRGGYNVHPVEVEAVLSTAPGVAEIAITSRDDPVMGETGVAVVVPADARQAPSLADLREHGCGRLAPYKLPETVRIVEALPLTSMEKLDRRALRELARAEPDTDVS
jgi:acyl-CoA synthetase (AMP-forming)/AMP-acid ligase II